MMLKLCQMLRKNKKGFTLVELMVVVVIIGILVAIAIPLFNATSAKAKEGACHANQRMIDGAIQQYYANTGGTAASVSALTGTYFQTEPKCKDATGTPPASYGISGIGAGAKVSAPTGCGHTHYSGAASGSWPAGT